MRKKLFTLIVCLLTTVTVSANVAYDEVCFAGHSLPMLGTNWTKDLSDWSSGNDHLSGTAQWDYSTKTLTLTNVMINRINFGLFASDKVCMWIETMQEVKVAIKGDCQLWSQKGTPLQLYGDVALTGNGTLCLVGSDADIEFKASDKTLTVDGPAVTLDGSCANAQLRGTADKTCRFRVDAGSVNFSKTSAGTPDAYAVMQMKSVSCATGIGIKTPHGAYFNSTGYLYDVDGNIIKGQEVLITKVQDYGIKIMGIAVTEANYDVLTKRLYNHFWDTAKDGKINYNPSSNTLTLEKVCIRNNTDLPTIDNISANGLKIILKGQNYFDFLHEDSKDNLMLRARVNTTIATTSGKSGSMANYNRYGGIYVSGGATLTLDGTNYVMYVHPSHIHGGNGTIDYRGLVDLRCNGHEDGTIRSVRFKKKMPLWSDMDAPRFIWNRTDGTPGVYESRTSLAKGEVRFVQEDENFIQRYKYIYVGDEYIHEYNKSCFMSGCIKEGYLTYSPYTKELTLHKATIETDASTAIEIPNGITMVLEGQNKIKCTSQNNPLAVFVTGTNLLTIKKDGTAGGSLTVTANVPDGGGILTNGELTINGDITVPNLTVPRLNVNSCTVNVTHQLKDVNSGKLAVYAQISGVVVGSTEQAPAYYDKAKSKIITKNGAVKIVKKSDVITYPGIIFCGEEINSANRTCVMNKFVKSGTIIVHAYDNGTKCNIDLFDVSFSGSVDEPVFKFKSSMSLVDFYINDNNDFEILSNNSGEYPFIESWANVCNIYGSRGNDNLVVKSSSYSTNSGAIILQEGKTLQVSRNASTRFSATFPRIHGQGGLSKLIVKDPYLTVTGNTYGTVSGIAVELPSDGTAELYSTPSSPREIKSNGVYSNGSICADEVKFVAKGESYIPVEDIVLDKRQVTLTKKGQQVQLNATVLPEDATDKSFTWNNWGLGEDVATVDANGVVTALSNGTTTVYACPAGTELTHEWYATGEHHSSCYIIVDIPEATGITLDRTEYTFKSESVGSIFVRATLTPDDADYDEIEWTSSDESIAYIVGSRNGHEVQVRPGKDGTCTLKAKIGNLTATCQITTRLHPTYVEEILFNVPDEVHLKTIGESFTITPTILPANATDKTIEWYSNTKDNVEVDQNGKVTAKNYGGSTVFAFAKDGSDVYKSVRVYVDRPPVLATGIEIEPRFPNTFYAIGDMIALTATITPANATNKTVEWKSDDESVATVNENGLVTITGWGSCHVTATTTDGTNLTSAPCYIDSEDPANIWEPVYGTGFSLDKKEVTIIKGDGEGATVSISVTPANFNQSLECEPIEDFEVFNPIISHTSAYYDRETNSHQLSLGTDPQFGQTGTVHVRVFMPDHAIDWETLHAQGIYDVPADTLTVHVIDPIIFTAKSPEGIDVTYHVPSLDSEECEVYCDYNEDGGTWDDEILDFICTPAVPVTASGKLTIPSQVTDSSTGKSYWVTSVSRKAFTLCGNLTEIEFSEGIRSIGERTCDHRMWALEKITLPSSIEVLDQQAFAPLFPYEYETGRSNIREVYIKAFTPPTGPLIDPYDETCTEYAPIEDMLVFDMIAEDAVLYVPVGAKENYNHYPWVDGWVVDEYLDEGGFEADGWFSRIEEVDFGDAEDPDGIRSLTPTLSEGEGAWYDLSGRKLDGKPTTPGIYIRGNKKVVIK